MFVHAVFMKFQRREDRTEAKRRLESMRGAVPSLRNIEVGLDVIQSSRSWDLVLITRFDDRSGYQAYSIDPSHQLVLGWLKTVISESATVDF